MSQNSTENPQNVTPPANGGNGTQGVSDVAQGTETFVQKVEKTVEDRLAWCEAELRKLLRLPEDAPLD